MADARTIAVPPSAHPAQLTSSYTRWYMAHWECRAARMSSRPCASPCRSRNLAEGAANLPGPQASSLDLSRCLHMAGGGKPQVVRAGGKQRLGGTEMYTLGDCKALPLNQVDSGCPPASRQCCWPVQFTHAMPLPAAPPEANSLSGNCMWCSSERSGPKNSCTTAAATCGSALRRGRGEGKRE